MNGKYSRSSEEPQTSEFHLYHGSPDSTLESIPSMPEVGYYVPSSDASAAAPPMASPTVVSTSTSWSATTEPYNTMNMHDQHHHHRPAAANYYGHGNLIHHPTHGFIHHPHQAHAAAAGYHYPNSGHGWHPAQVATPILSYSHHHHHYDQYAHQQHHPPQQQRAAAGPPPQPPHMIPYHALDSRGSINSLSSNGSYENTSSRRVTNNSMNRTHNPSRRRGRGSRGGGNNGGYHHHHNNGPSSTVPPAAPSLTADNNRGSWSRYNNNNNYETSNTLYQLQGRIIEVAQDRDGSKFIQRRLALANVGELYVAYEETLTGIEELWNDVYGNYIVQGLLQYGTEEMKVGIGRRIVEDGNVVQLSVKVYGCRLIQKALDTLSMEDVANIVSCIKGKVWDLVHDHNGNHVIQKSVTKLNEYLHKAQGREGSATQSSLLNSLDIIIDEVTASMKDLSVHPYGCRVVQRLIEYCTESQKATVLDCIAKEGLFQTLITHEYGNYVVQRVLAYGRPADKDVVFDTISSKIMELSKQKHSSNVVEMMLMYGTKMQQEHIIAEILRNSCLDEENVTQPAAVSMATDSFANYVIKTSLDVLEDGPQRENMFHQLLSSLDELEASPYAKQVVLRVKTYAQDLTYE